MTSEFDYTYAPARQVREAVADPAYAYEAGYISSEELFDSYFDVDPDQPAKGLLTQWEAGLNKKIGKQERLTKDEQDELFKIVHDGKLASAELVDMSEIIEPSERRALNRAVKRGERAKEKIFMANTRLAAWFVRESMGFHKEQNLRSGKRTAQAAYSKGMIQNYASVPLDYSERLQAALDGLWTAIEKHDYEKRGSFTVYAMKYMEGRFLNEFVKTSYGYSLTIPGYLANDIQRLKSSIGASYDTGEMPNMDEAVYEVGKPAERITRLAGIMVNFSSLSLEQLTESLEALNDSYDYDVIEEDGLSVTDRTPASPDYSVEEKVVADIGVNRELEQILATLTERENLVLELRFGMDGTGAKTLAEVGTVFGLNRERIRQIEAKALSSLRAKSYRSLRHYYIEDECEPHSGLRQGEVQLNRIAVESLNLMPRPEFDKTPSDKYKLPKKQKSFAYQEDWAD